MQTIETLLNHKTIRNYKSDPIDDKTLNTILEAGFRASTTGNMQVYSVIVTVSINGVSKEGLNPVTTTFSLSLLPPLMPCW